MPGAEGSVHLGAHRHVRFCRETAFGECPAVPTWFSCPIIENGFTLKATSPRYWPNTNYGGDFRRHVAVHHQLEVTGDMLTLLWPELTEHLLRMCLDRDDDEDVYSHCLDHYTPADPRRYLGAVVERMTLAFDGTGAGDIRLTHTLRAKLEEENDALVAGDFDYSAVSAVPFMFASAEFRRNGHLIADLETGTITVENNVLAGPKRRTTGITLGTHAHLLAQQRAISFESEELNNDDLHNEAIRDGGYFSLDVRLHHPDGHYAQIQLPRMVIEESAEDGTPDQIAKQSPRFEALAGPSGDDIIWGVDLGPATTTLAPITTTAAPTTTAAATTTGA